MGLFEKKQKNKAEVKAGNVLTIKVLGSSCKNCRMLLQNTRDAVSAMNLPAEIEYITDMQEIAKYKDGHL